MVNAGTLLRAPRLFSWEVDLVRRHCMNAARNAEKRRETVRADSAADAMTEAERIHIDFKAVAARRAP